MSERINSCNYLVCTIIVTGKVGLFKSLMQTQSLIPTPDKPFLDTGFIGRPRTGLTSRQHT